MAKKQPAPAAVPRSAVPEPEYTVVARRYRPQQFGELVGQEPVAQALTNSIKSGRVAHAYLFTGARGVGKTSTARILAKALNCVTGPTPTPCDKCDICKAIADGQDVDVQEIDGASNRGIEDARAIRNNVATRPQRARYKIYIIDEVHMLTRESFNALLKTLEEPPPHVKFIFATTEVQKIPITILSRCQRFDFAGISPARILEQLEQIVAQEGVKADKDALRMIARRAGGSMRDGQSLLEQLLSFGGGKLTVEAVHTALGTAADERVVEIAAAAIAKDSKQALELVARCADDGLQLGELLDQLIDYWRELMLLNSSGGEVQDLNLAEEHRQIAQQQAAALSLDSILAGLDILSTTKSRLRTSAHGQVLLEMAIVRLSRLDELVPVAQLAQWLTRPGTAPPTSSAQVSQPSGFPTAESKKNGTISLGEASTRGRNGPPAAIEESQVVTPISDTNLALVWDKVKIDAGPMHAAELTKAGTPAIIGPKTLALRFPTRYNHAYEYCREPARTQLMEDLLRKQTGQEWALRFEIDAAAVQPETVTPTISNRERTRQALESPLLSRIVSDLGGRLLKMDDGFGEESELTEPTENGDKS